MKSNNITIFVNDKGKKNLYKINIEIINTYFQEINKDPISKEKIYENLINDIINNKSLREIKNILKKYKENINYEIKKVENTAIHEFDNAKNSLIINYSNVNINFINVETNYKNLSEEEKLQKKIQENTKKLLNEVKTKNVSPILLEVYKKNIFNNNNLITASDNYTDFIKNLYLETTNKEEIEKIKKIIEENNIQNINIDFIELYTNQILTYEEEKGKPNIYKIKDFNISNKETINYNLNPNY